LFREWASKFLPLSHISGPQPVQHPTKFPVNVCLHLIFPGTLDSRMDNGTDQSEDTMRPNAANLKADFQPNCLWLKEDLWTKLSDTQLLTHSSLIGENTLLLQQMHFGNFQKPVPII
jgi:hypothetical protein